MFIKCKISIPTNAKQYKAPAIILVLFFDLVNEKKFTPDEYAHNMPHNQS